MTVSSAPATPAPNIAMFAPAMSNAAANREVSFITKAPVQPPPEAGNKLMLSAGYRIAERFSAPEAVGRCAITVITRASNSSS